MIYALDTNIISYILRGDRNIRQRWKHEEMMGNPSIIPLIVRNKPRSFVCERDGKTCCF